MIDGPGPSSELLNQSIVSYQSGETTEESYSNVVSTALITPYLTAVKSADVSAVDLGGQITYTLAIHNEGNIEVQAVLFDLLPDGTVLVPNSLVVDQMPQPGFTPQAGVPLGLIRLGQTVGVTFRVEAASPPSSAYQNRARIAYAFRTQDGRTLERETVSNTVVVTLEQQTLIVAKRASASSVYVGEIVTYAITVSNRANGLLEDVVLTDALPSGASFVSGSVTVGHTGRPAASPSAGIPLGTLADGASVEATFQAQVTGVPEGGFLSNRAEARYRSGGAQTLALSNIVTVSVADPQLTVVLAVNLVTATLRDVLEYTAIIRNTGTVPVSAVFKDIFPDGVLFVWGSVQINGQPAENAHPASGFPLGLMATGQQIVVTFRTSIVSANLPPAADNTRATVSALTPIPSNDALINRVEVVYTFTLPDGRSITNSASANTVSTTLLLPIIRLKLEVSPRIVEAGVTVFYRLRVTNTGNLAATVTLYDLVTAGVALLPGTIRIDGKAADGSNASWGLSLGSLDPQGTIVITYQAIVRPNPTLEQLQGEAAAAYQYQLNSQEYADTVRSGLYALLLEEYEE